MATVHDGFSATVSLRLEIADRILNVGQVGDTFLIFAQPYQIDCPVDAKLFVTVDDDEFPYDIHITHVDGDYVHFF